MRTFEFGRALQLLREGVRVTRQGWNGPGQCVAFQSGYPEGIAANAQTARAFGIEQGATVRVRPYLALRTADGSIVPWAPSVSDVLAEDWYAVSATA